MEVTMSNAAAEILAQAPDSILDTLREAAHAERRDLVNRYVGEDRAEKIRVLDKVIGLMEEEQAKRAGLASSEEILGAFLTSENLTLEVSEAEALPHPENDVYEVGQRIICVNLPHIGATVRSIDDLGVGLDYDTDDEDERGAYGALFSHIRPMPLH